MIWQERLGRMHHRLWWFDVVYPIMLAVILFTSLTYVVYSGTRQMRLSSIADNVLLQLSLRHTDRQIKRPGEILIVTTDPKTLSAGDRPAGSRLPEANAQLYAATIRQVSAAGVPLVYLSWDIEAHSSGDEAYMRPLFDAIAEVKPKTKVIIAAPFGSIPRFPAPYRYATPIVEDGPCNEPDTLQTQCSFNRSWSDWVVQSILNELGESKNRNKPMPPWVSELLNNAFPAYILNLNKRAQFEEIGLKEILQTRPSGTFTAAFIGADQSGAISSMPDGYITRRVITAHDKTNIDVNIQGTPLHVFWAQLAQMYLDEAVVSIPSQEVIVAVVAGFCLFVMLVMWSFGGPTALGMFLVYVAAGPFANALAIEHLKIYVPLFDSYYFGMTTFLLAGFGRLSYSAFQRWRLEEQTKIHTLTADLKGNFISLLSHNLNTPVAKMQGMLALLSNQPGAAEWNQDIRRAESYVAQLELGIRGVLIGSALDEGSIHAQPRSISALMEEFENNNKGSLRRLGVRLERVEVTAEEEDLLLLPLSIDPKVVGASITAACAMFADFDRSPSVHVRAYVGYEDDQEVLTVTVGSDHQWISASAQATLCESHPGTLRTLDGTDFFNDVAGGLIRQTVDIYGGKIWCTPAGLGGSIQFTLRPF